MNKLSSMRCVVFGGGGFIGTNLCRSLAGKVDSLRAFGRRKAFPDALAGIDWIPGDFTDSSAIASAVAGCDTVFHLVTTTTPASSNVDKIVDLQSNVISTLHLLDACREEKVRRVVFVSSGGTVYGPTNLIPTPEIAPINPITAYGVSKISIEKYLALYEHLYDIEYRVLRVANPFGPFQVPLRNQGVIAAFISRALAGKPIEIWGDGSVVRDYVYVDDVVSALELASVHTGTYRIFNIGSGQGHSLHQILALLEEVLGRSIEVRYRDGRKVDVPVSILDVKLASSDLAWHPTTSLHNGIEKAVDWMQLNCHLE